MQGAQTVWGVSANKEQTTKLADVEILITHTNKLRISERVRKWGDY